MYVHFNLCYLITRLCADLQAPARPGSVNVCLFTMDCTVVRIRIMYTITFVISVPGGGRLCADLKDPSRPGSVIKAF